MAVYYVTCPICRDSHLEYSHQLHNNDFIWELCGSCQNIPFSTEKYCPYCFTYEPPLLMGYDKIYYNPSWDTCNTCIESNQEDYSTYNVSNLNTKGFCTHAM